MYIALDIIGISEKHHGFIIKDAVERTLCYYIPGDELISVRVEIGNDDDMPDTMGLCDKEDDDEYTIYINKDLLCSPSELYRTVCHECVHIKQYHLGELEEDTYRSSFFNGQFVDHDLVEYKDRPWEVEAYQAEKDFLWAYENNQQYAT